MEKVGETNMKKKKRNKKTAVDNQWAGIASAGKLTDHKEKTEFSNEWASTNKLVSELNAGKT